MSEELIGRDWIAMELVCEIPDTAPPGAWPAFWLYTDTDDPNPGSTVMGASEMDILESFTYNTSSGRYHLGNPFGNAQTPIYTHPNVVPGQTGDLLGSNISLGERRIQLVWSETKQYIYVDGELMNARNWTWRLRQTKCTGW